jgi:hypothetical protein
VDYLEWCYSKLNSLKEINIDMFRKVESVLAHDLINKIHHKADFIKNKDSED